MSNPLFEDLERAIKRLDEILQVPKTGIVRDSAIKRFELCFDLCWKSIKTYAKVNGLECYSPRECFKTAFQMKLIDYNEQWLKMIDDCNLTTHLYKEQYADEVYTRLAGYLIMFKNLLRKLE